MFMTWTPRVSPRRRYIFFSPLRRCMQIGHAISLPFSYASVQPDDPDGIIIRVSFRSHHV